MDRQADMALCSWAEFQQFALKKSSGSDSPWGSKSQSTLEIRIPLEDLFGPRSKISGKILDI